MPILAVFIANAHNGLPIYHKQYRAKKFDETLLMGFFSALKTFLGSLMQDDAQSLKSIHLGQILYDFENVNFTELGLDLDVIVISNQLDSSTSHAICTEISEQFVLYLDVLHEENENIMHDLQLGKTPNFSLFDGMLDTIINSLEGVDDVTLNLDVTFPIRILELTGQMFRKSPYLAETYEYDETAFLEQTLSDMAMRGEVEENLRTFFKRIIKS